MIGQWQAAAPLWLCLQIREENPRLARDSKILRVTMENVYEVFATPRDQTGLQGIHFRFMPDMRQVQHALELYREAGVPTRSFVGVPVFQAEGLTVTTQEMVSEQQRFAGFEFQPASSSCCHLLARFACMLGLISACSPMPLVCSNMCHCSCVRRI